MRLGFLSSRKNWLCFAKSLYVLFCKIITRARKAWVPGDATELARRHWLCSAFSCGVELSCVGTLADDIDRSSAPHQVADLAGNTPAKLYKCLGILSLRKNWLCSAKSLYGTWTETVPVLIPHFHPRGELLALLLFCFAKCGIGFASQNSNFLLSGWQPSRPDTISIHNRSRTSR